MQPHSTLGNIIGIVTGAVGGLVATPEVSDGIATLARTELISILHVAVGAFVGAVIGFFTTWALRKLFKTKT